jgi:hypothetical protein
VLEKYFLVYARAFGLPKSVVLLKFVDFFNLFSVAVLHFKVAMPTSDCIYPEKI